MIDILRNALTGKRLNIAPATRILTGYRFPLGCGENNHKALMGREDFYYQRYEVHNGLKVRILIHQGFEEVGIA
jgi:hypothetical protein